MKRSAVEISLSLFAVLAADMASALNNPPYEVYPYLAENTDNPPVNYMKVCDPGVVGEANASYVVLGVDFPRFYQAVNGDFEGDLVIPAYIDGLPVRKIMDEAFVLSPGLRSVRIPHTVREVGSRAFADCYYLTNVWFDAGTVAVGDGAFSNCLSLASVSFPKTLSRLGAKCFQGCVSLSAVRFSGNAPRLMACGNDGKSYLGESVYRNYGYYERFKIYVDVDTYGWKAPYEKGAPEKWPAEFGYMQAHDVVGYSSDGGGSENSGFVTVITEIRGGAVAVPETWAARFPAYAAKFGGDFTASLTRPTGKKDASGNELKVWHDYVAGTDPTDVNDVFKADIEMAGGEITIKIVPELPAAEKAKRRYTVFGRKSLFSGGWTEVKSGSEKEYNFFKVAVEMR